MTKPYDYKAKPTRHLISRVCNSEKGTLSVSFLEWDYIAQAVHAKAVCEKLAEYLKEKIPAGEPLSDEVICYLVLGVDRDQLINALAEKAD